MRIIYADNGLYVYTEDIFGELGYITFYRNGQVSFSIVNNIEILDYDLCALITLKDEWFKERGNYDNRLS